jgi:hypothetical protein
LLPSFNANIIENYTFQSISNHCKEEHMSFAAFSDTHIGGKYQYYIRNPKMKTADYLDKIGDDLINNTNLLDFAIHLGDIVHHNTAHVNGIGLPKIVNQYKNNLKDYLISHVNLPFYFVIGNHDINDYQMNKGNPHNLTLSIIDELSMNNPAYAMMRNGILFLVIPELAYVQWTHPVLYEWVEYMISTFTNYTTIIFCHQAIEDTTFEDLQEPYRGKQDMDWWANLFQDNPQIKMWIHGHNHYLSWYVGNQSSGDTKPVEDFGHEMAFSAPYSQFDWGGYHEEDKIVIYNISSSNISTSTWENNGFGGHWLPEYIHTWNVSTTFNPNTKGWYSFPMFLQDNETQLTDMKILSPKITLQLIGTDPMELFYDSKMESPSGWSEEIILGFGNDRLGNVKWIEPGMRVKGPTKITFPDKYPHNYLLNNTKFSRIFNLFLEKFPRLFSCIKKIIIKHFNNDQEDGRSGQPFHRFPMGTIGASIPGQMYNFSITGRCINESGRFRMNVSCSDWGTKSQYSTLNSSENQIFSHTFTSNFETISGTYTVPEDNDAWFLQGCLEFIDPTDYEISLFSVKRQGTSNTTDDFNLFLSGKWYNVSKNLDKHEIESFQINTSELSDDNGILDFTAFINGNKFGMINLVYQEPILISRNARFSVNNFTEKSFNISLVKTISRSSNFFKLYPFSTDSKYDNLNINADDDSGIVHQGENGNLWVSCNCPKNTPRFVTISI